MNDIYHVLVGVREKRVLPVHMNIPSIHTEWFANNPISMRSVLDIILLHLEPMLDAYFEKGNAGNNGNSNINTLNTAGDKRKKLVNTFIGDGVQITVRIIHFLTVGVCSVIISL